jgi:subtilisin family serine protease
MASPRVCVGGVKRFTAKLAARPHPRLIEDNGKGGQRIGIRGHQGGFCMFRILGVIGLGAAIALVAVTTQSAVAQGRAGDRIPDHYIVKVVEGASADAVAREHGLAPNFVYGHAVKGFAGFVPPGQLKKLLDDSRVVSVTPDRMVQVNGRGGRPGRPGRDPGDVGQSNQVVPSGIVRIGAEPGSGLPTGQGVGVAVVDTGVDLFHTDLIAVDAFSAFGGSAQDDHGHGTHVAGTVAALDNDQDVVGVSPEAVVYGVKVLSGSGSGSDATVIAGLDWIAKKWDQVDPKIQVANLSLGRPGSLDDNPALRAAVQQLTAFPGPGITVVVAAGNDCDREVSQQVTSTYPEVLAVASTTAEAGTNQCRRFSGVIDADTASVFTTDGAFSDASGIGVTISAPGASHENITKKCGVTSVGILSTALGGGTTRMSGTSMAAPHTAGVAALLYEQAGGGLDPEDVRTRIMQGAELVGNAPLPSPTSCHSPDGDSEGILSAPGALAAGL